MTDATHFQFDTREDQELIFSNIVYQFQTFHQLPHESIERVKLTHPAYAEKLASMYGSLLATLSKKAIAAGQSEK